MKRLMIKASFKEFEIPEALQKDNESSVTPGIIGTALLKYGKHAYYFRNYHTLKGLKVTIRHKSIISPGFSSFVDANYKTHKKFKRLKSIFQKYHYGFNIAEQLMYMTTPHSVTEIGNGRFVISFMVYFGFLLVDCNNRTVEYHLLDKNDNNIMGNHTWYDLKTNNIYLTTFSLKESFKKIEDPNHPVNCKLLTYNLKSKKTEVIWSGIFSDYLHDINIDPNKNYCTVCEFSMYEENGGIKPSSALIIDLNTKKHWIIPGFKVAAHSPLDPEDPNVLYFSNHNFRFVHTNIFKLLKNAIFSIEFKGPALVEKYRITKDGPIKEGSFTEPDMLRMQNMHVFFHKKEKIIAGLAFPDKIYLADANTMKLKRKIKVSENGSKQKCSIGSFSPSLDGKHLYIQTLKGYQVVDTETGKVVHYKPFRRLHLYPNHMQTCHDIKW